MQINDQVANSLEQLLESLIKMVGKANQNNDMLQRQIKQLHANMDSLHMRINQLEWILKEAHLDEMEMGPSRIYSTHPQTTTTSTLQEKRLFHL